MSPVDIERLVDVLTPFMHQTRHEALWTAGRVQALSPAQMLVLGAGRGGVAALLASFGRVVAVDRENRPGDRPWAELPEYCALCPNARVEMVIGDAGEPATFGRVLREYDLVFIDGDHDLKASLRDWSLYGQLGRVVVLSCIGGYNCLSCLQPECYGPPTIWSVLRENPEKQGIDCLEEFLTSPGARGIGIAYRQNGILEGSIYVSQTTSHASSKALWPGGAS